MGWCGDPKRWSSLFFFSFETFIILDSLGVLSNGLFSLFDGPACEIHENYFLPDERDDVDDHHGQDADGGDQELDFQVGWFDDDERDDDDEGDCGSQDAAGE